MKTVDVLDSTMSYQEAGSGTPLVFLHGNPTSSYLWRRVLARIEGPGWLLAPDLIGMGGSGKPPVPYRFADHARYLDAWFDALGLDDVVLAGHDWGCAHGARAMVTSASRSPCGHCRTHADSKHATGIRDRLNYRTCMLCRCECVRSAGICR